MSDLAPSWDTAVLLRDPSGVARARLTMSALRASYAPLAVFAALTIASAAGWSKKRRAILVGGTAVLLFVVLSRVVAILRHLPLAPGLGLYQPGKVETTAVELAYRVLVNPPGFEYLVPAFIWLVSFSTWKNRRAQACSTGNR
jgi:hypothetical protein